MAIEKKENIEADEGVKRLECEIAGLFGRYTQLFERDPRIESLNKYWLDLRVGNFNLKFLSQTHDLRLAGGTRVRAAWDTEGQKWNVVGIRDDWWGNKVQITRVGEETEIAFEPLEEGRFEMAQIMNRFARAIRELDKIYLPFCQAIDTSLLGGHLVMRIDKKNLALYSLYAGEGEFDLVNYYLEFPKDRLITRDLCERMTMTLRQAFFHYYPGFAA